MSDVLVGALFLFGIIVVQARHLNFPFHQHVSFSPGTTPYPPYFPLLCIAKRFPLTYHDEHHWCFFFKCRHADAGARRCLHPGLFDDWNLRASIYVVGYITFALYFC
jgi:hypothetical protein